MVIEVVVQGPQFKKWVETEFIPLREKISSITGSTAVDQTAGSAPAGEARPTRGREALPKTADNENVSEETVPKSIDDTLSTDQQENNAYQSPLGCFVNNINVYF